MSYSYFNPNDSAGAEGNLPGFNGLSVQIDASGNISTNDPGSYNSVTSGGQYSDFVSGVEDALSQVAGQLGNSAAPGVDAANSALGPLFAQYNDSPPTSLSPNNFF